MGDRAPHRADQWRCTGIESGHPLPRSPAFGTDGLDRLEVGRVRKQSAGQILCHHTGWQEAARRGSRKLGADLRYPRPVPAANGRIVMTWFRVLGRRLSALFRAQSLERDLDDELSFHLDMEIAENLRRGMNPPEARQAALRRFGGVVQIKETYRETRGVPMIETTWQDVRYGFRMLGRDPGFSFLAILCLTLGIGAITSVCSWIEGILLRPFPLVARQDRMFALTGVDRNGRTDVS